MKITILTIFPEMFASVLNSSILGRAREQGLIEVECVDIRPFSDRKHKNTDDYPFGGGAGMVMLAGHYEGVDQRALDACIDEEISIGDYILTGGELAAMVLTDCVARFIPGVLGSAESPEEESFSDGLLEYPQYTRPRELRGMEVPEILLSGDHAKIRAWRRQESLRATKRFRPDLLEKADLTGKEKQMLEEL